MSGKRYPGELKIEAVKQVVDRDLPPELSPGMFLATSALGRKQSLSMLCFTSVMSDVSANSVT